jgi:hypothetical protein
MSDPQYYEAKSLSEESQSHREPLDERLSSLYAELQNLSGLARLKLQKRIDLLTQQLDWQGANPKAIPFEELRDHIRNSTHLEDGIESKYQERISSRATGIRAYCVMCQGGDTAAVRMCVSLTCPLHPFRMGKDPLRGWDIPKVEMPVHDDIHDGMDDSAFEDDDTGDTDAKE